MTQEDLAYIAGFLDGDGCIMLQLIYRKDYLLGYQIRASIIFFQKTNNRFFLEWLKTLLVNGSVRDRNDGMSEYALVGPGLITDLLEKLSPYLRLKKKQAVLALSVLNALPSGREMTPDILLALAEQVDKFAELNYSKKRTNTALKVKEYLMSNNLINPVETDS